jgi:hypothetical protein
MNPIGGMSPHTQSPVHAPARATTAGSTDAATRAGADALLEGQRDFFDARATAKRGVAEMAHTHGLVPCERQALVELLAWHALAEELYASANAPDALLGPPSGPDAEQHLARSVHIVLQRARRAAVGAEAADLTSITAEREQARIALQRHARAETETVLDRPDNCPIARSTSAALNCRPIPRTKARRASRQSVPAPVLPSTAQALRSGKFEFAVRPSHRRARLF